MRYFSAFPPLIKFLNAPFLTYRNCSLWPTIHRRQIRILDAIAARFWRPVNSIALEGPHRRNPWHASIDKRLYSNRSSRRFLDLRNYHIMHSPDAAIMTFIRQNNIPHAIQGSLHNVIHICPKPVNSSDIDSYNNQILFRHKPFLKIFLNFVCFVP